MTRWNIRVGDRFTLIFLNGIDQVWFLCLVLGLVLIEESGNCCVMPPTK